MKIATVVLLVCQVGMTLADAQCSDSLGNCPKPRGSLMQLKTLKQKQKLQTAFGAQLASFQKFTDEMVAKYAAYDPELDNVTEAERLPESNRTAWSDTQTAVATVLEFIDTMHESLLRYHNADKTKAASCSGAEISQTCETTYLGTNKTKSITEVNATANSHHENFIECMGDRATACAAENTLCERYDEYRQQTDTKLQGGFVRGDGTTPQYLDDCVKRGDFDKKHITALVGSDDLKAMEICLGLTDSWLNGDQPPPTLDLPTAAVVQQYDGLYPHYSQCDRTRDECEELHEHCRSNQSTFEDTYCSYEQTWDSSCGAWQACYNAAATGCKTTNGDCDLIQDNVQGRKADNETGMRLKCLLQVLFGKWDGSSFAARLPAQDRTAALTTCTNTAYNTSDWNIACDVGETPSAPDICTKGMCHGEPATQIFKNSYYISEGLSQAPEDVNQDTQEHGINKYFFDLGTACAMLTDHESFWCDADTTGPL